MNWYLTGFIWLLQIGFWGLGLSWLVPPRRWRRFWPAFCPVLGLGLQSSVVWAATHTALPGTDSYALVSQLLPAGLLAWAVARNGGLARALALLAAARGWWAVGLIMALSLSLQLLPFTKSPGVLTSTTLGSCDPADYAAGARVFKEFSSRDRSGFLGDREVVQLLDVDNFFDFWLRLNHFTPSALLALEATWLGRQPYELPSLLGAVLLVLNLPGVFWLTRAAFRLNRAAAVAVTLIYAFSPILFYALYQAALGQLLAAPAIALLTWVGVRAYHGSGTLRHYVAYSGLLLGCNWLILGSYNFFILFAYVPLAAYVGGFTLWRRAWAKAGHWSAFVLFNLLACALLFPGRVMSIADRFRLFNETSFGWRIPAFPPAGWLGVFDDVKLLPAASLWAPVLAAAVLATLVFAVCGPLRRRPRTWVLAAACSVPILIGYAILLHKEAATNDNSSYDAYKLFSVFYPGILAALCLWMGGVRRPAAARPESRGPEPAAAGARGFRATVRRRAAGLRWLLAPQPLWAGGLALALVACNVAGAWRYNAAVRLSLATVDNRLAQLAAIEQMTRVHAVNICLSSYWQRLWANYFLLHKPQYFPVATYEGRRITPLRGGWDLCDSLLSIHPFDPRDSLVLNEHYYLIRHRCRDRVQAMLAGGWYLPERDRTQSWAWCRSRSQIAFNNPHPYSLRASVDLTLRSIEPRRVRVSLGAAQLWEGTVGPELVAVHDLTVPLPMGVTFLRLETPDPLSAAQPGESRQLAFALYHLQVDLQTPPPVPPGDAPSFQTR